MSRFDLVGDGVENPHNALVMMHAARMFGGDCSFLDTHGLATQWAQLDDRPDVICGEDLLARGDLVLALDHHPTARSLYGYRPPAHRRATLVAGNERQGVSRGMLAAARDRLVIPMASRKVTSINVASASAVALYYLCNRFAGAMPTRSNPQKRRPELLLIGGGGHVELGSAIRSACAFGWSRVFVEDRGSVWFEGAHGARREARAAARRAKNAIRVIPTHRDDRYQFQRATIVTCGRRGTPLHRARLAQGPSQLLVLADESAHDVVDGETLSRFAGQVEVAHIEIPAEHYGYYFRLMASIAMAESARQVGQKAPWRPVPQEPLYESALATIAQEQGEVVTLDDLAEY